jgi:hypothetical protein
VLIKYKNLKNKFSKISSLKRNDKMKKTAIDRDTNKTTPQMAQAREGLTDGEIAGVFLQNLPLDSYPQYVPAPAERVQAHGNCYIVQGTDRTGRKTLFTRDGTRLERPKEVGYGVDGYDGSYSMDLVVGRAPHVRSDAVNGNPIVVTAPNFDTDAARIYLSQQADIDFTLGLRSSVNGVPDSIGRSAIGIKADAVRIVGREGIKIVTGVGIDETKKNSQGGPVGSAKGIDLIASNRLDGSYDLQPIPKGLNLANFGIEVINKMKDIIDLNIQTIEEMNKIYDQIDAHVHNSPFFSAPTTLSLQLTTGKAARKIQMEKLKLGYKSLKELLTFVEQEYLVSTGEFYINSINNRTN